MAQPLTEAEQFYNDAVGVLQDRTVEIPELSLHRFVRDAKSRMDDAQGLGLWALWTIVAKAKQRLAELATLPLARRVDHLRAALEAHKQALHYNESDVSTLISLGKVLGELDDERGALEYLARAERVVQKGTENHALVLLNQSAAYHHLGERDLARSHFARAVPMCDAGNARLLQQLAVNAALLGYEDDAVELLARALTAMQGVDLGDRLPIDILRAALPELAHVQMPPMLARAVAAVARRADEPIPDDMATSAGVTLSPAGWDRFLEVLGA